MSMTAETSSGFTAADAVRTLDELKGYEETLAARTAGLTIMIWGFVVAGIPLTYQGFAGHLAQQGTWGFYVMALLWAPWVAGALIAMAALWKSLSITLRRPADGETGKTWLWGIGFTALFFVIATLVHFLVGFQADTFSVMGVTTGLLTLAIATANHRAHGHGRFWIPFYAAGALILLTGLALVLTGAGTILAAFTTASVQGLAYFLAGIIMVARG
jgi:hypothetical protein